MKAAEKFFALTGATIDERIIKIAESASTALTALKAAEAKRAPQTGQQNNPTYRPKYVGRWAARHLDLCVRTVERLPPLVLVALIVRLHDAATPPDDQFVLTAWHKVVAHKAIDPDKSTRDLAAIADVSHTTVAKWLRWKATKREIDAISQNIDKFGLDRMRPLLDL